MATQDEINSLMSHLKKGNSNAIHASNLAKLMGLKSKANQEELRAIIRDAILNNGKLIGSLNCGYWEIETIDELKKVLTSLEKRAKETNERKDSLLRNWNALNPRHRI